MKATVTKFTLLIALIHFAKMSLGQISVFSNTTGAAYNSWDSGNAYTGFQRTIAVSGLPATLLAGATELRQVNLDMGDATNKGNLSTYNARLISPSGTTIQLFSPFNSTSTSQWMRIKLRDHASLERVRDYATSVQQGYYPWSIGYYRTDQASAFAAVIGENPNGNWTLQIQENTSTEVSFVKVELVFGPPITVNDVTAQNANNSCANSTCIDNSGVTIGTNNGYSQSDPLYPGSPVSPAVGIPGGCEFNGANNNSAWFHFIASATTANITLSGITNPTPGSADTQPVIFEMSGDCSGTYSVPSGGCPDDDDDNNDEHYLNNMVYANYSSFYGGGSFMNGGGISTDGNIYVNGISANCEFNLTGLTIGQKYFLYIDGNGGTSSTFYIEAAGGVGSCSVVLPLAFESFDAEKRNQLVNLNWKVPSDMEISNFNVERSTDGINWTAIENISANLSYNPEQISSFNTQDLNPENGINYYRIKSVNKNNQFTYSVIREVVFNKNEGINLMPNPTRGEFTLCGLKNAQENNIRVCDLTGKIIQQYSTTNTCFEINLSEIPGGLYLISVTNQNDHYHKILVKEN